jgi:hypothetical protein
VAQEGAALLVPYMSRQILRPTAAEMRAILEDRLVGLAPEARGPMSREPRAPAAAAGEAGEAQQVEKPAHTLDDASTVEQLKDVGVGCCVAMLRCGAAWPGKSAQPWALGSRRGLLTGWLAGWRRQARCAPV